MSNHFFCNDLVHLPIETTIRLTKPLRGVVTFENQSTFIPSTWSQRGFKQCLTLSNLDRKKRCFCFFLHIVWNWKTEKMDVFSWMIPKTLLHGKVGCLTTFSIFISPKLLGFRPSGSKSHITISNVGKRLSKKWLVHLNQAGLQHAPSSLISSKEARKNLMGFFFTPRLGFFFESTREGWSSIHGVDSFNPGRLTAGTYKSPMKRKENDLPNLHDYIPCNL